MKNLQQPRQRALPGGRAVWLTLGAVSLAAAAGACRAEPEPRVPTVAPSASGAPTAGASSEVPGCAVPCAGTCLAGRCVTVPASGQDFPGAIAVDRAHVYWAVLADDDRPGKVMKVPLGGGPATALASGPEPCGVAVDGTHVYWTSAEAKTGAVMKVPITGGAPVTLVAGQEWPCDIAVAGGAVYWVGGGAGRDVFVAPAAGGPPLRVASGSAEQRAVGIDGRAVYWRKGRRGGVVATPHGRELALTRLLEVDLHGTAIGRANAYWGEQWGADGGVWRAPVDGGEVTEWVRLAEGQGAPVGMVLVRPMSVAVDDEGVYVLSGGISGSEVLLVKAPLAGGPPKPIVYVKGKSDEHDPRNVVVDETSAYWVEGGPAGRIVRVTPK